MPAGRPSGNKYSNPRICTAAERGQIITLRCHGCGRTANYLASDLLAVLDPNHELHIPPWPCSRCRTTEWIDVSWHIPSAAEEIIVRRPVKKVTRWLWRSARL